MQATVVRKHHVYFYIRDYDGSVVGYTFISNGARQPLGDYLLRQVRAQLNLETRDQLLDLVRCPLSRDAALGIMRRNTSDRGPSNNG
jgi:hypothetical protein